MNKFVVLAFAFFALGFYEMSGGADFDPEEARSAAMQTRQAREASRPSAQPAAPRAAASPVRELSPPPGEAQISTDTDAAETGQGLNLVSFASVANPQPVAPETPSTDLEVSLAALAASVAAQNAPLDLAALTPTDTPPPTPGVQSQPPRSIIFPGRSVTASSSDVGRERDVRTVKGSLVNMRSGPGTDFDVVDQLPQATRVEVLTDTGNGWVELRPVEGGLSGWVAAFLLADG